MQPEKNSVLYLNSQAQGNKYFQKPLGGWAAGLKDISQNEGQGW